MIEMADFRPAGRRDSPGDEKLRVVGLMSGTSCDGVDAALVDVTRRGVKMLAFRTFDYSRAVRQALLDLCRPETARVDDICHWNFALGEEFASAVVRLATSAGVALETIDAIGSHGHTIWHDPQGRRRGRRRVRSTLQIGEPCVIAERTGIATVADFRPRDLAAGGQGAPLVPYVDFRLFSRPGRNVAALNIGGIANVTFLPASGSPEDVVAFDTGPGNMIIDRLVHHITAGEWRYDRDGSIAHQGRTDEDLLASWLAHPYFRRRPPKSTGREEFGDAFADELYARATARGMVAADIVASATALTAAAVADACRRHLPGRVDEMLVSGGGAHNLTLTDMLAERLAPAKVRSTAEIGLDPDAKEALAFAVLAAETIWGRCNNLPAATGARRAVVLGKVVPPAPGHFGPGAK